MTHFAEIHRERGGFRCPACKEFNSTVTDSRATEEGQIRRRRKCLSCLHRWTTFEVLASQLAATPRRLIGMRAVLSALKDQITALEAIVNFEDGETTDDAA